MGFNYGKEKRIFESRWKRLEIEYRAAGFHEEGITEMREYDWDEFKRRRIDENREQTLPEEGESSEVLLDKFPALSYELDESEFADRFGWIETIGNEAMAKVLVSLPHRDKEVLTLLLEGYTQAETADFLACSQVAISKRIARLRNLLAKGL